MWEDQVKLCPTLPIELQSSYMTQARPTGRVFHPAVCGDRRSERQLTPKTQGRALGFTPELAGDSEDCSAGTR